MTSLTYDSPMTINSLSQGGLVEPLLLSQFTSDLTPNVALFTRFFPALHRFITFTAHGLELLLQRADLRLVFAFGTVLLPLKKRVLDVVQRLQKPATACVVVRPSVAVSHMKPPAVAMAT